MHILPPIDSCPEPSEFDELITFNDPDKFPVAADALDEIFGKVRSALQQVTRGMLILHAHKLLISDSLEKDDIEKTLHINGVLEELVKTRMDLSCVVARIKIQQAQTAGESIVVLYREEQAQRVRDAAVEMGVEFGIGGQRAREIVDDLMTRGIIEQSKIVIEHRMHYSLDPDGEVRESLFTEAVLQLIFNSKGSLYGEDLKGLMR